MVTVTPYIPRTITVHLGAPDSYAANVSVAFSEYVKNVASSEIYPTWDESALTANILAIISFALNANVDKEKLSNLENENVVLEEKINENS